MGTTMCFSSKFYHMYSIIILVKYMYYILSYLSLFHVPLLMPFLLVRIRKSVITLFQGDITVI